MLVGTPDFEEEDIEIRWDQAESKVGLRIRGELWAAFDINTGEAYGGNYKAGGHAEIPTSVALCFESASGAD